MGLALLALLSSASCAQTGAAAGRTEQPRPDSASAPMSGHVHPAQHGDLPATAGAGYTVADVRFMQNMIGHHAQALTMAALAPSHGAGARLLELARKIDISQRDEIAMMKAWLEERGQAVPGDAHVHAMSMPGMLSAAQMRQLEAARGEEFERLFLTFMIQHHRGALRMVDELFAARGAGQDPDIFRFATDVDADQRDEIFVMQGMLDMLEPERGSRTR